MINLPGASERTVLFTAPSKTFNLAGLAAGTLIVLDERLRRQVSGILAGYSVRGSNLFAYTAMNAAYRDGGAWVSEVRSYVEQNMQHAIDDLGKRCPGLKVHIPESTFLLWVDCRCSGLTGTEISRQLAASFQISVNAGDSYGREGEGFIRINAACPASVWETCLDAISSWYKTLSIA